MNHIKKYRLPSVNRPRILTVLGLFITSSSLLPIQNRVTADDQFPEPAPVVKTYEWSLSPAKEPVPALRYKLLTDLADSIPGNAAVYYTRAILIKSEHARPTAEQFERINEWYDLPLEQLPIDEVRKYVDQQQGVLAEIKTASMCETCDWGVRFQDLRGMSAIEVRLPEFQETRALARILRLKAKLEILEKRFDDAITTIRQSYQLARHVGTSPILIPSLIAIAIEATANDSLGEFLSSENAPNMYWALRELPDPVVNIESSIRFESTMAFRLFPFLNEANTVHRPVDEWQRLLSEAILSLDEYQSQPKIDRLVNRMKVTAMIMRSYPIAKRHLIGKGYDPDRVEKMPVGQVVAIYARDCHQYMYDESMKWMHVSFAERGTRLKSTMEQLVQDGYLQGGPNTFPERDPLLINSRLSYSVANMSEASIRQRIMVAALIAVEAIRMHASANAGKLPASLDEIKVVPVPLNPATGKPFLYRVVDGRAELLSPPHRVDNEFSGRRFLLKMR